MDQTKNYNLADAPDVLQAIKCMVDYLWEREKGEFASADRGQKRKHIFHELTLLRRWLEDPSREPSYFGDCPKCKQGGNDGYLNIGRGNWFFCHLHRLRWCTGDLITTWRLETEDDWKRNWNIIGDYKVISVPVKT